MTEARIYQNPKNAMQSGRATSADWYLDYEPAEAKRADALMGWAGSGDVRGQVHLRFGSLAEAQAFAVREGLGVTVVATAAPKLKLQAYADNFR